MKTKKMLLSALCAALLVGFFSCDKDNDDDNSPTTYTVADVWVGTYTVDQLPAQGALEYNFFIKPNGTLVTQSKGANAATYYAAGTWTLTADTLRCTYTTINFPNAQVTQTSKFAFNSSNGKLTSGTWKDGAGGSNFTGTYTLERANKD